MHPTAETASSTRSRVLCVKVALLAFGLSQLMDLLIDQFNPQKDLIVFHDLKVAAFIVHVHAIFAIFNKDRKLFLRDLKEIEKSFVLPNLCLCKYGCNNEANNHYHYN